MLEPGGHQLLKIRRRLGTIALAFVWAAAGCAGRGPELEDESAGDAVSRSVQEVQEAHTPEWMAIPGVIGTGIGLCDEEPCIKVFVARRTEEIEEQIPEEVEGYQVRIEVTGEFRALDTTGSG